jgi:ankyrin repeat protein
LKSFFFKETLEILLENGAKMDFSSINHVHHISPLGYALEHCINEAIEILIQYGANPNFIDSDGKTALIRGVEVNNIEGVKLLLILGANPTEKGSGSLCPIDIAFQKGNAEILNQLIESESLWYTK